MFINCRHCRALVATDPVSDLPPLRCPRCRGVLRTETPAPTPAPSVAQLLRPVTVGGNATYERTAPAVTDAPVETPPADTVADDVDVSVQAPDPVTVDRAPAAEAATPSRIAPASAPPAVTSTAAPSAAIDTATPQIAARPSAPGASATPATTRASPSFARPVRGARGSNLQQRWLLATVVTLTLLLALQVLLADRARLGRDPGWRPVLLSICSVLRCALPPWHEPTALTLLARDVRPDPATPGLLQVSATFRNDARWPQAWPRLVLTLSDLDGHAIGTRAFAPEDYLAAGTAADVLAADQTAAIRMSLVEPGTPAVSFAFEFR